jgi:HEAT repeat protein
MRIALLALVGWALVMTSMPGQEKKPDTRFGVDANGDQFPQKTAKETLDSVIKAIQLKRVDYLLAQLTDPAFVDQRVKEVHGGKFDEMVRETTTKLIDDPDTVPLLRRFAKDGEWENGEEVASVKLKDITDRVFFKKINDRWFLENSKKKAEK